MLHPCSERTYLTIKALVKEFKVPPGTVLSAATLASELLVSVTPVREALIRLADQGYIDLASHKGFSVIRPSLHYYQSRYELIDALTCRAILSVVGGQSSDSVGILCDHADEELSRMESGGEDFNKAALIESLLTAISTVSHNEVLIRCLGQSIEQTSYLRRIILADQRFMEMQLGRIHDCFQAIRRRNGHESCEIVRQALSSVITVLPNAVESLILETFRKNGSVL